MISPETKIWLGALAPAIGAIGDAIYIWSILRGTTRPHLFSWIVWMLMLTLIFCGQIVSGAGPGAWFTGYNVAANFVVITLAVFHSGERTCTRGDWIALIVALAGIPVWAATKDPLWSICLETALAAVIYYPTYRKTYRDPYSEHPVSYILFTTAVFVQIAAVSRYSAASLIYPIGFIIMTSGFIAMLYWRRRNMIINQ